MLLAIAYAPASVRARLRWLLSLDQRLSDVLNRASEPMIAQLRLSWWRDALKSAPDKRPKGEPLFAALGEIEPDAAVIDASLALIDAFEILAVDTDAEAQSLARMQRVTAICDAYAIWAGCGQSNRAQIDQVARSWGSLATPIPKSLPRLLRPISIMALAEHLETSAAEPGLSRRGVRLNWHALTGR
jgi:15-cis-phytoene synthase